MKAYKISEKVYWVGAIDWKIRNFHGYETKSGSTYNAYLILADKITLIDTVKAPFAEEMIERISSVIDITKIDYIVSNHVEMDHSGALSKVAKLCPNAKIFTSAMGLRGLKAHYGDMNYSVVESGSSLELGNDKLTFVTTPMVHWPDSMVSYLNGEKILFSNDAFGQHYASSQRIDTDVQDMNKVFAESDKYYANIVLPFAEPVGKAISALGALPIELIAPSHGIMWKKFIPQILTRYGEYVTQKNTDGAVIIYDSMWGSTEKIATAIADGFDAKGINFTMIDLKTTHNTDAITAVMNAKYVCIGSATLNNGILPTVASFLCYMKGLRPLDKKYISFGSFGWSGQACQIISDELAKLNFTKLCDDIKLQYIPSCEQLQTVRDNVEKSI